MKPHDPLAFLAAVVRKINAAAYDRAALPPLLDELADSGMFSSTILFAGRANVFIFVDARGVDAHLARRWLKWPLRRVFATMLPRCIVHPDRTASALVIPFDYGDERCLVLATLGTLAHEPKFEPFFEALEHFTIGRQKIEHTIPENIPLSPVDPEIIAFGLCPALQGTIESMLARRAWRLRVIESYAELRAILPASRADMLLFDADHESDPFGELVGVHTALPEATRLIAFGGRVPVDLERQALADALVDHDAAEIEIFAVLKRFARQVPEMRRTRIREMMSGAELALKDSRTPAELSVTGARYASEVMASGWASGWVSGWASLHLVSEQGVAYTAEHPRQDETILAVLPKTFLSDAALFQIRADERFFQEVSDDRRVVGALNRLQPVSAASIPLRHGARRLGALVSISREAPVDSTAFEALDSFARIVTGRFEEFSRAAAMLQSFERSGVWEYVRHGRLEMAVYRSRSSSVAWDYRVVRPDLTMLSIGDEADSCALDECVANDRITERALAEVVARGAVAPRLVAACNPIASTFTYAAAGFPAPLLFDALGPAGAMHFTGAIASGTVTIVPPAGLLVWDHPLRQWLMRESVDARSITETLEDLRPPGLAIVITSLALGSV